MVVAYEATGLKSSVSFPYAVNVKKTGFQTIYLREDFKKFRLGSCWPQTPFWYTMKMAELHEVENYGYTMGKMEKNMFEKMLD